MRILHICTGNPFTETMYYKENYFLDANIEHGHTPIVLADTTKWEGNRIVSVPACDTVLDNGVRVIRVNFQNLGQSLLTAKIRKISGFVNLVVDLQPDVILFHNIFQEGILHLKEIRQKLPACKIYGDVSATTENSARNFFSMNILHKLIYRSWIQKSLPYWTKIFFVTDFSKEFMQMVHGVPETLLELNALPARIMDLQEKNERKTAFKQKHALNDNTMIFFHSGKMDAMKKTIEMLRIVEDLPEDFDYRLFIAGKFYDDIREEAERLIARNEKVTHLGFLSQDEMQTALAACDFYLQPGSASQTAQAAIACGTPLLVSDARSYGRFIDGNGYLIGDPDEMKAVLDEIRLNPEKLQEMSVRAYEIANEFFEYHKLAARLYI